MDTDCNVLDINRVALEGAGIRLGRHPGKTVLGGPLIARF